MATARDLLDAEEREQARLDLLAERLAPDAAESIDDLLHNPQNRDEELWQDAGVSDIEVTIDDYEAVAPDERGPEWVAGLAAMVAAAKLQVLAENRDALLTAYRRRLRLVNGLDLSPDELVKAGAQGIDKRNVRKLRDELRDSQDDETEAPGEELEEPSLAALAAMSNADFIDTLQDSRMIGSWASQQTQAMGNVQRMVEREPGTLSFLDVKSDLIANQSTSGMQKLIRRSSQQYTTLAEMDGDASTDFVWVTETDDAVCSQCKPRGGEVHTYAEWLDRGLPGAAVCLGDDNCRCDLVKVDTERLTTQVEPSTESLARVDSLNRNAIKERVSINKPRTRQAITLTRAQRKADRNARIVNANLTRLDALSVDEKRDYLMWNWVHGSNRKGSLLFKQATKDALNAKGIVFNRNNLKIDPRLAEKLESTVLNVYNSTQEQLRERGIKTIRLYRGVKTDTPIRGVVESWTSDRSVAESFGGKIMVKDVPAKDILNFQGSDTWNDGIWGNQKEYMVIS